MLEESIEKVRKNRTVYRAKYIPLDELYTRAELHELEKDFGAAVVEGELITELSLEAILVNMGIALDKKELDQHLAAVKPGYKED